MTKTRPLVNKSDLLPIVGILGTILAIVTLPITIWVFSSYMEASSFNKITGKNVSTWEAMFVDLRVQSTPE